MVYVDSNAGKYIILILRAESLIFSDTGIQNEGNAHCDSHLLLVCMTNSYRCVSVGRDIALHNTFDLF